MSPKPLGLAALGLCALALGCTVETVDDSAQAQAGSTHALISIARQTSAAAPDDTRADAFAGFLRAPAGVDAASALRGAGLGVELPGLGECRKASTGDSAVTLTRVELLEAGEVTLAAGGNVTTLALRAFPTVTDSISGVVYTTRDRASTPLPAASAYTFATTGSSSLGPLSGDAPAPAALSGVLLGGEPLGDVEGIPAGEDLKLAWDPGSAGDRIYVELDQNAATTVCAFGDAAGEGSIPSSLLPVSGEASLAVHRLRQTAFTDDGLAHGELRFDFELSASVSFE